MSRLEAVLNKEREEKLRARGRSLSSKRIVADPSVAVSQVVRRLSVGAPEAGGDS